MNKMLSVSVIVLIGLGVIAAFVPASAHAATAGVCSADIQLPQNKEELSRFDVEHALRQLFARAGQTPAKIESRHAGEDIIAASVYLASGKLFWSIAPRRALFQAVITWQPLASVHPKTILAALAFAAKFPTQCAFAGTCSAMGSPGVIGLPASNPPVPTTTGTACRKCSSAARTAFQYRPASTPHRWGGRDCTGRRVG